MAGVVASLVDAIIGVIAFIGELLLRLFASCVRSLRYAFSSRFRQAENERLEGHGSLYRLGYASLGVFGVATFLAVLAGLIYWIAKPDPTPAEICSKLEWLQLSDCAQAVRDALPK